MKVDLLEEGARAPAFTLKALSGGEKSLAELIAAKPTILAFLKVSCPVCQMTFPYFERMSSSTTHQFVSVSQDHAGATANFNSRFGVGFPSLLDEEEPGYPASNSYGLSHVPTAFLIEPDGKISWVMEGFSKTQMKELGRRVGVEPFAPGEYVPEWKSG